VVRCRRLGSLSKRQRSAVEREANAEPLNPTRLTDAVAREALDPLDGVQCRIRRTAIRTGTLDGAAARRRLASSTA
jgi:hypothetical protein